jgi:formylglycine-generating enzyme required for sulfatase activity
MTQLRGRKLAFTAGAVACTVLVAGAWTTWPHLRFWWLFEPLGLNAQGQAEYRHRRTGIVLVRVPGGTFWMGAQKTDPDAPNFDPEAHESEGPVHEVTLSPFLIGKYELTQAEWVAVMGSNLSRFQGDDRRPVEQVSFEGFQEFEARTGLALPTEAQWERACRAGRPTTAPGQPDEEGWYNRNCGGTTHPVGEKAPSALGIHDMHGNVAEACEDVDAPAFYSSPEARRLDPVSTVGSASRMIRGGCWRYDAADCGCSRRASLLSSLPCDILGFRVAYGPVP